MALFMENMMKRLDFGAIFERNIFRFQGKKMSRCFPVGFPEDHDPLMAGSPSAKESGNDTKALEGRKMYGYPVGGNQGGGEGAIRLLP